MAKWAVVVPETCIGCGLCAEECPEVFTMTEDNVARARKHAECEEHDLEDVAGECPVGAITVESDE